MQDLWFVTPCKGRLDHLRTTLPTMLATSAHVMLVDYSCPDHCGNWASAHFSDAVREGQLAICRVATSGPRFSKPKAHNAGARAALARGAEMLAFIDCDTLVEPNLASLIAPAVDEQHFAIFEPVPTKRDLYGFLAMTRNTYRQTGGYDERFYDWGMEDLEYRLRLRLQYEIEYRVLPATAATPIRHDDSLRTRFYSESDKRMSNFRNFQRVQAKVRAWTGMPLSALPAGDLRPLLGYYA